MDLLAVQSANHYILFKSGVPSGSQTQKEVFKTCKTPEQKKKLKDCQPICLKCRGVFNCYCSFARTNNVKPFVCVDCGKRYAQESYLIAHQRCHYHKQPYRCSLCVKSFKKPAHLKKHQKTHLAIEYKCSKCQMVFHNSKDLNQHKATHREPKLCITCGEKFNSFQKLNLHVKETHSELPECTLCHQRFRYKTALVSHQREHLENKVLYNCYKCKKVYTSLSYLLRHIEVHCKDKSGDADLLPKRPPMEPEAAHDYSLAHIQDPIPLPSYDEVKAISWSAEEQSSYVIPLDPGLTLDPAKDRGRNFKRKERLAGEHTGGFNVERLFRCKTCKKCFRHNSTLIRHQLSHSLVLTCHHCGKRFGKMLKLFLHRYKHERRRRPYKCKFCEKAFSFQSLLHLHQHTHNFSKPGHGGWKSSKPSQLPSKETSPNTKCITPSSLVQHQTSHGIKATKDPSNYSHDVPNIKISPATPKKILGKRPHQEMACKDYVKRVCYRSCDSRYTM